MSDNRPARYIDPDGTIVYRASALGMCDRIFAALAAGYDPMAHPEWFQQILDEGTEMEDQIRAMWEDRTGVIVGGMQGAVDLEVMDGVVIRGHIDGEIDTDNSLWEAKKMRPSTWEKFKRSGVECMPTYPWQTSAYMHALNLTSMHFVGGLYDVDNNEIVDVYEHTYHAPPINMLAIRKRIAKLEGIINDAIHVTDVACPSTAQYPCPFYYLHDDNSPQPKERPADEIIVPILAEWVQLQEQKAPAAKIVRDVEARIKELKDGVTGWWEAAGLEPGDTTTIKSGDREYEVKLLEVARKGYTVDPSGYEKITVKAKGEKPGKGPRLAPREPAEKPAAPVKKVAAKKAAAKKATS